MRGPIEVLISSLQNGIGNRDPPTTVGFTLGELKFKVITDSEEQSGFVSHVPAAWLAHGAKWCLTIARRASDLDSFTGSGIAYDTVSSSRCGWARRP